MKIAVKAMIIGTLITMLALAACGSASLSGTTWKGAVALTEVTVNFESGGQYASSGFDNGNYSISGDQVTLVPTGGGETRVFVLGGSLMQGTVDGWPCTLTKQ